MIIERAWQQILLLSPWLIHIKNNPACQEHPDNPGVYLLLAFRRFFVTPASSPGTWLPALPGFFPSSGSGLSIFSRSQMLPDTGLLIMPANSETRSSGGLGGGRRNWAILLHLSCRMPSWRPWKTWRLGIQHPSCRTSDSSRSGTVPPIFLSRFLDAWKRFLHPAQCRLSSGLLQINIG